MIETSQLQTLVAVAETKSFSKAADDLGVTQSAISQSVKNLESKLEIRIFERAGKKVALTLEGKKLYDLAIKTLARIEKTIEEIKHNKNEMSGRVRFGTLNGIGKSWLAPEIISIAKEYPDLTLEVSLGFQESLVKAFEEHRLDFLVAPEFSAPSSCERVFLGEERATLVFPKGSDYQVSDKSTLKEIMSMPTILFSDDDPLYHLWCRSCFGEAPAKVSGRYIANSHGNMLQAVHQGLGIAVVPTHVFKRSHYRDLVNSLPERFDVVSGRFYLYYHQESFDLLRIRTIFERLTDPLRSFGSIIST